MELNESQRIIDEASAVLKLEADSIIKLADRINHRFAEMVDLICNCAGRVIISGIGKSGR